MHDVGIRVSSTLAAGLLIAAACGGGGDAATFDIAKADTTAHEVLPAATDLPGSGWSATENDQFDDPNDRLASDSCSAIQKLSDEQDAKEKTTRKGRAQVNYNLSDTDVEFSVNIFDKDSTPSALLAPMKKVLQSGFADCFRDEVVKNVDDPSATIEVANVAASGNVPVGGFSESVNMTAKVAGETTVYRFEQYVWAFRNAGVSVNVAGDTASITPELVQAAIDKLQANLEAASR
jgi:hypothetical protein